MKTTSRKRLLISSVAMLLVAMLALGTATFAWFSTSTTAKANNFKVKTIQASNLLIRKGTDGTKESTDWATQIDYDSDGVPTLEPASTKDFNTWVNALADTYNSIGTKPDSIKILKDNEMNGYRVERPFQLYYKADENTDTLDVDWSFTINHDLDRYEDFLRVAILDSSNNPVFVWGKAKDGDSYQLKENSTTEVELSGATNVTQTDKKGQLITFNAGEIKDYKFVVWYEGTDPQCIDSNAVTLNNISFTFAKRTKG